MMKKMTQRAVKCERSGSKDSNLYQGGAGRSSFTEMREPL